MRSKLNINMFEVEVFEQVAVEYRHILKKGGPHMGPEARRARPGLFRHEGFGKCEGYFSKMMGQKLHS